MSTIAFKMGQRDRSRGKLATDNAFDYFPYPTSSQKRLSNEVWIEWLGGWIERDLEIKFPIAA